MNPSPDQAHKPRLAFAVATSLGLGYLPKAPGTWGALAGVAVYAFIMRCLPLAARANPRSGMTLWLESTIIAGMVLAAAGVWSADRASKFAAKKDPQFVVIDEVSGQHLTYALALAPLNWQYLLLGFILFRAFDIWKPFPARQAESLPGGLGIMADDWAAGLYAAMGLWLARYLGM